MRISRTLLVIVIAYLFCPSCSKKALVADVAKPGLQTGLWRMVLTIGDTELPFTLDVFCDNGVYFAYIINASEKIKTLPFRFSQDSAYFKMPVFDCEFAVKMLSEKEISGQWNNYARSKNYSIPVHAEWGKNFRFPNEKKGIDVSGRWEVTFSKNTADEYKAIGIFEQKNTRVTGTFLTESGDYRFLEGIVSGNELLLSCFDGSHAFLFTAFLNESQELIGSFYSGKHWKDNWIGVKNENFSLTHPDSLTFMNEGHELVAFRFPNTEGEEVVFPSEKYKNKVIIIQIMGSWCPNCMDETRLLTEFYNTYHAQGLEIISLCFERSPDFTIAAKNVALHKSHLGAAYEFLICGSASKESAAKVLPMLNHVMSFPTSIFIDKKGKVRKIHTGFYGPGTGGYYYHFVDQTTAFVEKLLNE